MFSRSFERRAARAPSVPTLTSSHSSLNLAYSRSVSHFADLFMFNHTSASVSVRVSRIIHPAWFLDKITHGFLFKVSAVHLFASPIYFFSHLHPFTTAHSSSQSLLSGIEGTMLHFWMTFDDLHKPQKTCNNLENAARSVYIS